MTRLEQWVNPVADQAAVALRFLGDAALAASRLLEQRAATRAAAQRPVIRAAQPPAKAAQAPVVRETRPKTAAAPVTVPPKRVWPNRVPSKQVLPTTAQTKQAPLDGVRPKPVIDPAKRGQALGMLGRGEQVHSIAGALQAPRNEIELLLKAKQLMNSGA